MGVGDGWPNADRSHAAFLYRLGSATLLIDCGESIGRVHKARGWNRNLIDRILISHLHFDHLAGFFMLLQGFWLQARTKALPVHLPAEGLAPLRAMLRAGYLFEELLAFRLRFAPLRARQPIAVAPGVRVTPFPTSHLQGLRAAFGAKYRQPFAAFSFLVEAGGRRLVHGGDLGAVEDLAPLLEQPVDLVVCELAHVALEPLGRLLASRGARRVVFVHLPQELWRRRRQTERRAAAALGSIPFTIAAEGEELTLA